MNLSRIKLLFKMLCLLVLLAVSSATEVTAQENSKQIEVPQDIEMADVMRSNGKIYVVVAVILSIFSGLIFYTVRTDMKISKLEKGEKK